MDTRGSFLPCFAVCGLLVFAAWPAKAKGFGETCIGKEDCHPAHAECIYNKCTCKESDYQLPDRCLLPVGGKCDETRNCEADNSQCIDKHCICKPHFIQAYNNSFCYKEPNYDEYCQKDHDCLHFSVEGKCIKNKCRCQFTHHYHDNKCKKKINELGARCESTTDVCYLESDGSNQAVECRDGTCRCKTGATPSENNMSCGAGSLKELSVMGSIIMIFLMKFLA